MTYGYSLFLTGLSLLIALLVSYTALNSAKRFPPSNGRKQQFRLIGGAAATSLGIWSMHFIAMLAFRLSQGATYHFDSIGTVLFTILLSFIGTLSGFAAARPGRFKRYKLLGGGAFMGLAFGGMQAIGMSALQGVSVRYSPPLLTLSVMVAIIASITALYLLFHAHRSFWMNGLLLGIVLTGMSYSGMASATLTLHDDGMSMPMNGIHMDNFDLAIYVAFGTIVIFGISLIGSLAGDKRLAERLAWKGSILDSAIGCLIMFDRHGTVIEFNPAAESAFGFERGDVVGRRNIDQLIPRDSGANEQDRRKLAPGSEWLLGERLEATVLRADGSELPIEMTVTRIKKERSFAYAVHIRDLTERIRAERVLRESEERYRRLIEYSPEAIFVQQDGLITFVNASVMQMLDFADSSELVGNPMISLIHEDYRAAARRWQERVQAGAQAPEAMELKMIKRCGRPIDIEAKSILVEFEGKPFVQTIARDITEKKQYEDAIKQMAYYDTLTGLPNRNLFHKLIEEALGHARQDGQRFAVMFLDIDRFKIINDTMGHPMGDLLLQRFAALLSVCIGNDGTVSRLSGDEFVVTLPCCDAAKAETLARGILLALTESISLGSENIYVTSSIGIALYPSDGDNAETLMKHADCAMYAAKTEKNGYRFFDRRMDRVHSRQAAIEQALHRAIGERRFSLRYQPMFDARTKMMTGVEAFLRWSDPMLGSVPPEEFIPIAEESGQMAAIGEWVLHAACEQMHAWHENGLARVPIFVNVSARQFHQDQLVPMLRRILQQTGLQPKYLALEAKEGVVLEESDAVFAKLGALKDLGVCLSIDDFGTGGSASPTRLQELPIRTIKIDMSILLEISKPPIKAAMETISAMGRSLPIEIIAKRVETEEQFLLLERLNCTNVQGCLFSQPLSAEQFEHAYLYALALDHQA